MDTLSMILIALCAVLLVAFLWAFFGRKAEGGAPSLGTDAEGVKAQLAQKDAELERARAESRTAEAEAKALLEKLKADSSKRLQEANDRIRELEAQVSEAIASGGADELIQKRLAEVDKLAKKVKALELDLEEAKEGADDLKKEAKKLKEKNEELERVQEELEGEIRKSKQTLQEFEETKRKLEGLEQDFATRGEALDFVTEVLTAKASADESVRGLYELVDDIQGYISQEVRDCLKGIFDLTPEREEALFGSSLIRWATSSKKTWIQGKTSIAFVGEFSAGKTSIVNRILSQDREDVPKLPVSTKATTAIPTYISGGTAVHYQFVTPSDELKGIEESTFRRINKEVLDEVKGISSLIKYFVMTYKNPELNKLSILDTPGFASGDAEDHERTIGVMNECDALFWVVDVNTGTVNRSSCKIIKEHLTRPVYVVINQIDTKAPSEVDKTEARVRKTFEEEGIVIEGVIRFSKVAPLEDIMKPIRSIQHDDSGEAYLSFLLNDLQWKINQSFELAKEESTKAQEADQRYSELIDEFIHCLEALETDCVEASEIPQYNERWFSENDYRMSQEQYRELMRLLETIAVQHRGKLVALYKELIETLPELQESSDKYYQYKSEYQQLEACYEALKKKVLRLPDMNKNNIEQ